MTLTKEKADEFASRVIINPAITLVAMTTPTTLFKNLDITQVADGFLGRFIIHQSDQPRMVHDDKDLIEVPHRIVDWINRIETRAGRNNGVHDIASEPPEFVTIPFSNEALVIIRDFNQYCVELCNSLERVGMDALPGRSKEMAMRLALIVAVATNPDETVISSTATKWAIDYVRFSIEQTIKILRMNISGSEHEAHKKEILQALREAGEEGVTWTEMQKTPPFSQHKQRDLKPILQALVDAELCSYGTIANGKPGRPRVGYIAIE